MFDLVIPTQLKQYRMYFDVLFGFKPSLALFFFSFPLVWFDDSFVGFLFFFLSIIHQ